jgi:general secretion pathway protein K
MSKPVKIIGISNKRGMVLPSVLWITILTIVIATNYASAVHLNTRAVDNIKTATLLKYDSISGVYLALERLLAGGSSNNVKYAIAMNNNRVAIEIRPENMKTSLNEADARKLRATFIGAGINPDIAETLADRVIDWRDPDHSAQPNGMEDNGYFSNGKNYGAKDKSFEDLVELLLIADIDAALFRRLSEYFTIYGKGARKIYTLTSRASNPAGDKAYVVEAVVQLTRESSHPYRVLKWQYNPG